MNWDNIRVFISIHRHGSLALAAKELGINHSTVLRRVATLERELRVQLFRRAASGYEITMAGERILDQALTMESDALALQRRAAAEEIDTAGSLNITTPPMDFLQLMPMLAAFRQQYSTIELNVDAELGLRDLDTMQADVAIRMTNDPPQNYVGREILRLPFHIYASAKYVADHGPFNSIADIADWIIVFTPAMGNIVEPWLKSINPLARIHMRINSGTAALAATELDIGACLLPQHLAETSQQLVKLPLLTIDACVGIWLLTHGDLRFQPRVRKFMDFMQQQLVQRYADYASVHCQR
jgi:DNA-binding transcriptional LysR family regulator